MGTGGDGIARGDPISGMAWHTSAVPWLVNHDARVLASAEVAGSRSARRRGLLGRDHMEGALVLRRCRWIHTMGMRFPVESPTDDDVVIKTMQMHRNRVGVPVWRGDRDRVEAARSPDGAACGDVIDVRENDT
jgi:hypothetical protein